MIKPTRKQSISIFLASIMLISVFAMFFTGPVDSTSEEEVSLEDAEFYGKAEFMNFTQEEQYWAQYMIYSVFNNITINMTQTPPPSERAYNWTNEYINYEISKYYSEITENGTDINVTE